VYGRNIALGTFRHEYIFVYSLQWRMAEGVEVGIVERVLTRVAFSYPVVSPRSTAGYGVGNAMHFPFGFTMHESQRTIIL
jgi:hypothetical protein